MEQYPNSDWARYKAKYTATFNPALGDPKYLVTVTKFQNRIVMDTSMLDSIGQLFFVKRYLEKYPSSL